MSAVMTSDHVLSTARVVFADILGGANTHYGARTEKGCKNDLTPIRTRDSQLCNIVKRLQLRALPVTPPGLHYKTSKKRCRPTVDSLLWGKRTRNGKHRQRGVLHGVAESVATRYISKLRKEVRATEYGNWGHGQQRYSPWVRYLLQAHGKAWRSPPRGKEGSVERG
ncbi:hypothetical protein C8F04DRAFT_1243782, partial [Mycena alexandri]